MFSLVQIAVYFRSLFNLSVESNLGFPWFRFVLNEIVSKTRVLPQTKRNKTKPHRHGSQRCFR